MSSYAKHMKWVEVITGDDVFTYLDPFARYTEVVGWIITEVVHAEREGSVCLHFEGGFHLAIRDDGQSCCETRYITCDDDLTGFAGGQLVGLDLEAEGTWQDPNTRDKEKEKDNASDDYEWSGGECHETQFVKVTTTKGSFTLCTHNEHSGYYGGFSLTAELIR